MNFSVNVRSHTLYTAKCQKGWSWFAPQKKPDKKGALVTAGTR
jgi:hypothetical protein